MKYVLFLCLASVLIALASPADAGAPRHVRVGWFLVDGLHNYDRFGNISGYDYDYIQALAQYADWDCRYIVGTWATCLNMLKNGEIDLVGGLEKTRDLESILDYSSAPAGYGSCRLVVAYDNKKFAYEDFKSFDGITVGTLGVEVRLRHLREYSAEKGFSVKTRLCESVAEMEELLDAGEVDAILVAQTRDLGGRRVIAQFAPAPFYFVTPKGNDEFLRELNDAMSQFQFYNLEACLKALKRGDVDCTYMNTYALNYFLSKPEYFDLTFASLVDVSEKLSLGISKKSDRRLFTIVSKALRSLPSERLAQIVAAEQMPKERGAGIYYLLASYPRESAFFSVLFIAILLVALVSTWRFYINRRKNLELERADRAKSEFLANMSHEMRTPLSAIIGLGSLAKSAPDDRQNLLSCLDKIDVLAQHLLSLINDVLDLVQISKGTMSVNPEPMSPFEMIDAIRTVYARVAEQARLHLECRVDSRVAPYVVADPLRLKQLLINLLANAIKYNRPEGHIVMSIALGSDAPACQRLHFSVSDDGIGISAEDQKRIFKAFDRAGLQNRSDIQGTGLGLAISTQLVELMGGKLEVVSELGKGSEFFFDLTLLKADPPEIRKAAVFCGEKWSGGGRRVLVAEDNAVNALILRKTLERMNLDVTVAKDGVEALESFQRAPLNYFSAVLLDIRMPRMDGCETARRIRELQREDARKMLIVALSANAFHEDVQRSLDSGMNAHLPKPVNVQELSEILAGNGILARE